MKKYDCNSMQDYFATIVSLVSKNKEFKEFKEFKDPRSLRFGVVNFDLDVIVTFQLSKFNAYYDKPMFLATKEQREMACKNYALDYGKALSGILPEDRKKDVVGSRWETTKEKIGDIECTVSRRVDIKSRDN